MNGRRAILNVMIALLIVCVAVSIAVPTPSWVPATAALAAAVLAWLRFDEENLLSYLATLPLTVPQGVLVLRLAFADAFMLPVLGHLALDAGRRRSIAASTLTKPFAALVIAAAIATAVGYVRVGRLTTWALLNKDAGLLFLVAGFYAMTGYASTRERLMRLVHFFVGGVSVANLAALAMAVAAKAGFDNAIYMAGNSRMFGWMGNPSVTGGLLLTAVTLELGMIGASYARTARYTARWVNVWLLGLGLSLTLSRSTWTALVLAMAVLLIAIAGVRERWSIGRLAHVATLAIWVALPGAVLWTILAANIQVGLSLLPQRRTAELRDTLVGQCAANPALDICAHVQMPPVVRTAAPPPEAPAPPPSATPAPGNGADVAGPLMNARGLRDRIAILASAWSAYTATTRSMLLGIGLGTFYATSAANFSVALIIHNTFLWILVELGPLGLAALLWIWAVTARNLWISARRTDESRFLAFGAMAAFAGLTMFCLFNEGLYQRQLWLVMVIADRLRVLGGRAVVSESVVAAAVVKPAPALL